MRVGLVMALLLPTLARAAEESTLRIPHAQSPSSVRKQISAEGEIKFEFTQYAVPLEDNPKLNQSALTQAGLKLNHQATHAKSQLDFSAGRYLDLNNSFFSVQELYTSLRTADQNHSLAVGRKLEFWSQVDREWQLGLWEPKFNIDPLRPLDQGLSGAFAKSRSGDVEFLAYASPVFIPTMSPEIAEKNGALVSDWRWYKTPAVSGDVLGKEKPFVYSLSIPEASQLVNNPGAGLRLQYGDRDKGFWSSFNAARKPINSLFVKYDYKLAVQASQAEIQVRPVVAYHRLMGADLGWSGEKIQASLSYLQDDPESELPKDEIDHLGIAKTEWVQQKPGSLRIYAAHMQTQADLRGFSEPVGLSLDYLKADEHITEDFDSKGQSRGSILPSRLNFGNAFSSKITVASVVFAKPLETSLRVLRDFDQKGNLTSFMTRYFPRPHWSVYGGFDILAVDDSSLENTDPRFLNQFRANDRVFGGLGYVF